jgi:hypothetical protein
MPPQSKLKVFAEGDLVDQRLVSLNFSSVFIRSAQGLHLAQGLGVSGEPRKAVRVVWFRSTSVLTRPPSLTMVRTVLGGP